MRAGVFSRMRRGMANKKREKGREKDVVGLKTFDRL